MIGGVPAAVVLTGIIVVVAAALHAPVVLGLLLPVVGWLWWQRPRFARGVPPRGWQRANGARAAADWMSAVGRRPPSVEGAMDRADGEPVTVIETSTWWGARRVWGVTRLRTPVQRCAGVTWWAADDVLVVRLSGDQAQSWDTEMKNAAADVIG